MEARTHNLALCHEEPNIIKTHMQLPNPHGKIPGPAVPISNQHCYTLDEVFQWAEHGLESLLMKKCVSAEMVVRSCRGKRVTLSSMFSGVGFFDMAAVVSSTAINNYLRMYGDGALSGEDHFKVVTVSCMDKDRKCRDELLKSPHISGGACVYRDIMELLPADYRQMLMEAQTDPEERRILQKAAPFFNKTLHCVRHGKQCVYNAALCHSGGSPCTNHSKFGKMELEQGGNNKLYLIWMTHRKIIQEVFVFHENVCNFGAAKISEDLCEYYVPMNMELHSPLFGIAASRARLWTLLVHKSAVVMRPERVFSSSFIYSTIRDGFFRHVDHDEFALLFDHAGAGAEESWARQRASVDARRKYMVSLEAGVELDAVTEIENDLMYGEYAYDDLLSVRAALTMNERARLAAAQAAHLRGIVDLGQEFATRPRISRNNTLHTLIRNTGVMVAFDYSALSICPCQGLATMTSCGRCYRGRLPARRGAPLLTCVPHNVKACSACFSEVHSETLMTASECLAVMGMPVTTSQIVSTGGATSGFANHVHGPDDRSRNSMTSQAGNGMMTLQAGALFMTCMLYQDRENQNDLLDTLAAGQYRKVFPDEIHLHADYQPHQPDQPPQGPELAAPHSPPVPSAPAARVVLRTLRKPAAAHGAPTKKRPAAASVDDDRSLDLPCRGVKRTHDPEAPPLDAAELLDKAFSPDASRSYSPTLLPSTPTPPSHTTKLRGPAKAPLRPKGAQGVPMALRAQPKRALAPLRLKGAMAQKPKP